MSFCSLLSLLALVINSSLLIILLLDSPRSLTRRLFAVLVVCFAVCDVAGIIVLISATSEGASALFLIFPLSFPDQANRLSGNGRFVAGLLLPALTFAVLSALQLFYPLSPFEYSVAQSNFTSQST